MKNLIALSFLFVSHCSVSYKNVDHLAYLPNELNEVSGIETTENNDELWMINDSGNSSELFRVTTSGKIINSIELDAENEDWEDITTDKQGNVYIGNFGNNFNERKNLSILKVSKKNLNKSDKVAIERISFRYEDQDKFPPKKKKLFYDCEAFFHYNDSLYLFTKTRVKKEFGVTNLYRIPAKKGNHIAKKIGSFKTCDEMPCWITSADISDDGKQVVLMSLKDVWHFSEYESTNFLSGKSVKYDLDFESQKEAVCFKNDSTLLITDEKAQGGGGNLYQFNLH